MSKELSQEEKEKIAKLRKELNEQPRKLTALEALEELKYQIASLGAISHDDPPQATLHEVRKMGLYEPIEESLKALEIIKEKGIILQFIKETYTVEQYNAGVFGTLVKPLNQEEYELLKEVLL